MVAAYGKDQFLMHTTIVCIGTVEEIIVNMSLFILVYLIERWVAIHKQFINDATLQSQSDAIQ